MQSGFRAVGGQVVKDQKGERDDGREVMLRSAREILTIWGDTVLGKLPVAILREAVRLSRYGRCCEAAFSRVEEARASDDFA